jgi:hypothetical protein
MSLVVCSSVARTTFLSLIVLFASPGARESVVLFFDVSCKTPLACKVLVCASSPHLVQDFPVSQKMIADMWSQRKLESRVAKDLVLDSRCQGSQQLFSRIDWHLQEDTARETHRYVAYLRPLMEATLRAFHGHDIIDLFLTQFIRDMLNPLFRFKSLLFRGISESAKSKKAASLFGSMYTLVVMAQGMAPALPSIRAFDNKKHMAILWDEIEPCQVLQNKMVFQSGLEAVTLQQSACNAHSYTKHLFEVPMLLCSNKFDFRGTEKHPLDPQDTQWLEQNIYVVDPPPGGKWYSEN